MKNNKKKIVGCGVLLILLLTTISSISASTLSKEANDMGKNSQLNPTGYSHSVLVEQGTATWCQYCPAVTRYLDIIYSSGSYDFYYVALVDDKNPYARQRRMELGIAAFPTVVFDGGYTRIIGDVGSTGPYINALNLCGARSVADIDLDLDVTWLGNARIEVNLDLTNNEGTAYNGHLHAYVTEIDSRWYVFGRQYHFAMIGNYAFNQNVNVPANDVAHYTTIWDGTNYGFGDISADNIMVIATVFRYGTNYVDETAASLPEPPTVLLDGSCYDKNMEPVDTVSVYVLNLDTGREWQADTIDNHYYLELAPGEDINASETLRIIAWDRPSSTVVYAGVVEHIVTQEEINTGSISIDIVLDMLLGDMNNDSLFNGGDIDPFFEALGDPIGWQQRHPGWNIMHGDVNLDGKFDGGDIDPFFGLLGSN